MAATFQGPWIDITGVDNLSFQAKWAIATRSIDVLGTDTVVAATKTWHFANGAFTAADVGATFVIAGSVSNNGSFVVASVTNATTIVSVGAPGGNETFPGSATMTITDVGPTGTFAVQGSNDGPGPENVDTRLIQPSGTLGASTIVTVSSGNPAATASSLIIPITGRAENWARLAYTRASGTGLLDVGFMGKGI